jgi:hypothetical protein
MECCHRRRQYFSGRSEITVQAFGRFVQKSRSEDGVNAPVTAEAWQAMTSFLFHSDWMPDCMSIKRPQAN